MSTQTTPTDLAATTDKTLSELITALHDIVLAMTNIGDELRHMRSVLNEAATTAPRS